MSPQRLSEQPSHHQRPILQVPDPKARSQTLPSDLLERSAYRLRMTAWVAVGAGLVRVLLPILLGAGERFGTNPRELAIKQILFGGVVALAASLVAVTYTRLEAARKLVLGQVFFVAIVALLGASEAASPWGEHPFVRGIPVTIGILLVFPVIVPMAPRRFLAVSLAAIATCPIVMLIMPEVVGFPPPSLDIYLLSLVPLIVACAVSYAMCLVIYELGRDLGKAQKAGSYQLVEPLGKGGMGEVWRARHGLLQRPAAVKLIRSDKVESGGQEAVRRFEHEAKVVASLRSQHTIQLWDFGTTDDGALYYAMELLEGMDLDRLVQVHGPVCPERVVHFLVQACHSLVEAHEAGLVHRDIKPANLFVTRLGRDVDVVKVLDFGLATRPVSERIADARVTQQGMLLGTPAYMAPEQVLGEPTLGGRADLYTLGAVAWWLLTGRDLFQATSATQVMFAHVHVEPEPPSRHARHAIPPELDRAILRCLEKRREDRPESAEVLAEELRAVPFAEPWTRRRAIAWWQEHGGAPGREGPIDAVADTHAAPSTDLTKG